MRLVSEGISTENSRVTQGRLEVYVPANNSWSTVCDDGFTDVAASIVCRQVNGGTAEFGRSLAGGSSLLLGAGRSFLPAALLLPLSNLLNIIGPVAAAAHVMQLGLSNSGFAEPGASYGEGSGAILYDGVACTGTELTLQQCPRTPPRSVDCKCRLCREG